MSTEFHHFSDIHRRVTDALAVANVSVPHGDDMAAADQAIAESLAEFDAAMNPYPLDTLADAGAKWAKGNLKLDTLASRVHTTSPAAADTFKQPSDNGREYTVGVTRAETRRYQAARQGAVAALIDLHTAPEFHQAALVAASRSLVAQGLADIAAAANESVDALPERLRDQLATAGGTYAAATWTRNLDLTTLSGAHIDAARAVENTWHPVVYADPDALLLLFGTLASGTVRPARANQFPHNFDATDRAAVFLDADGMVAYALGVGSLSQIVAHGFGKLAPLADPLGADAETYAERLDATTAAAGWLNDPGFTDHAAEHMRIQTRGQATAAQVRKHVKNMTIYERRGFGSPAGAVHAYRAQHTSVDAA